MAIKSKMEKVATKQDPLKIRPVKKNTANVNIT